MENNILKLLTLEYIKAHFNIKALSVKEYYEKYKSAYNELLELDSAEVNKIAQDNLNEWLKH